MKSRKFTRFTIYKVLLVLLSIAILAALWGPIIYNKQTENRIWRELDLGNDLSYNRIDYIKLMRAQYLDSSVIPVLHGNVVDVIPRETLSHYVHRGEAIETDFVTWCLNRSGGRWFYATVQVDGEAVEEQLHLDTEDIANLYIAYLEDNDLVEQFESETGRRLTRRNAIWALQSVDRYLAEQGVGLSKEVPFAVTTINKIALFVTFFALPALIAFFAWLITRAQKQAIAADSDEGRAKQQAESDRWAETAKRLSTQAPIHSGRKQPKATVIPEFDAWCRTAVQYVPRFRRGTVYAELYAHLSDHYQALLEGRDPEAAARMALTAMGSAEETGRRLRRSERSVSGMIRNLQFLLRGSRWVVLYRGSDVKRYARLVDELTYAQIPFRREELDGFTRSNLANIVPGRGTMDNTPRRDGTVPSLHAALATAPLRENFPDQYIIYVRQRDMGATNRLSRT